MIDSLFLPFHPVAVFEGTQSETKRDMRFLFKKPFLLAKEAHVSDIVIGGDNGCRGVDQMSGSSWLILLLCCHIQGLQALELLVGSKE